MAETCECYEAEREKRKRRNGKQERRKYTIADLNRISNYVIRDQKSKPIYIIAELAYYHGFGYVFCSSVTLIDSTMDALKSKQGILATLAASKLAQLIVEWLTKSKLKAHPLINWASAFFILVIIVVQKTYKAIDDIILNINAKKEVLDIMRDACKYLRKNYGDSKSGFVNIEKNKDEIEELKKFIEAEAQENEIVQFITNFSLSDIISDIFKQNDMRPPT